MSCSRARWPGPGWVSPGEGTAGGIVAIRVTSFLWGTSGTAATFAPDVRPLAIGAAALPALGGAKSSLRSHVGLVVAGAAAVAVYPLAFYTSLHLAGVAIGTVVCLASAPLASGLLELVLERKALSRWWMLAALLGVGGSAVLCLSVADEPAASATDTVAGIGLGLAAGATYALYSWVVHRLMAHQVDRAAAVGAVFGAGGVLLLPVMVCTGAPLLASGQSFAVVAYIALGRCSWGTSCSGSGLTGCARARPPLSP